MSKCAIIMMIIFLLFAILHDFRVITVKMQEKIKYWENRLLDLGKKNKMIYCPAPKPGKRVSRASIMIQTPDIDKLWDKLVVNEGSIEFPIDLNAYVEGNEEDSEHLDAQTVFRNGYQTDQSVSEACKTLLSLKEKSKEFMDNKGLNALYLAMGFLNWYENGDSGAKMRSPLLLLPITITQESIVSPIKISKTDDDPICNNTLQQKIHTDFGIIIPNYEENEPIQSYLARVAEKCEKTNWKVDNRSAQISMFVYLKLAMYHDIETHEAEIAENPVIQTLNGESVQFENVIVPDIRNIDHDKEEPRTIYSVVDADSSQQDAITLAKAGVSFVLQGPPGTGKSQTITNFIAELLGQGKKVLFVSEKMAALEVVYSRLQKAGLGDFCLTLHNPDAKRKDIIDQLKVSVDLSESKAELESEAFRRLESLKLKRQALNDYDTQLHTVVQPLGESVFKANGIIASLDDYPDVDFYQENADKFTPTQLEENIEALNEFARIIAKNGYQDMNPWYGCTVDRFSQMLRQKILSDSEPLLSYLHEGAGLLSEVSELVTGETDEPDRIIGGKLKDVLNIAIQSPGVPYEWFGLNIASANNKYTDVLRRIKSKRQYEKLLDDIKGAEGKLESVFSSMLGFITDDNDPELSKAADIFRSNCDKLTETLSESDERIVSFSKNSFLLTVKQLVDDIRAAKENEEIKNKSEQELKQLENDAASQKEQLAALQKEGNDAEKALTASYNERILDIDGEAFRTRFGSDYKSPARILNSQYRKDIKLLKSYSRINERLSYKEAILLIEQLNDVQQRKRLADEKAGIVGDIAKRSADCAEKISRASENINSLRSNFQIHRNDLLNAYGECKNKIEQIESKYREQLLKEKESVDRLLPEISEVLGMQITENSDLKAIYSGLRWVQDIFETMPERTFSSDFLRSAAKADEAFIGKLKDYIEKLLSWNADFEAKTDYFLSLFNDERKTEFKNLPVAVFENNVKLCTRNFDMLETLIDYKHSIEVISNKGLSGFLKSVIDKKLNSDSIVPIYRKCFYRSWLDEVSVQFDQIFNFRRDRQENTVEEFIDLDKTHLKISREMLRVQLIRQLPDFNFVGNGDEASILKREINKKSRLMPIRKLIAGIPTLLPSLKPCMLMSPLSVSTYFGSSDFRFDTVIFDEASQVRTEEAICSIFRAKQVIIAGDSQQLPPTNFFSTYVSDDDEYDEDNNNSNYDIGYESLLDEAAFGLSTQTLLWHYRSKHEALIAFSNKKIYHDKLITFPSSIIKAPGMGVEYVFVENGIYNRGGRGGNIKEAKRIAELLLEHFRTTPERSVGIIAFGSRQEEVIENAVIRLRQEHPEIEQYFGDNRKEPLFIRNLESVQGDERDTIIFSIGYGYDQNGKFNMNFGPLSREGGERRLNVAITRARYNLKLVGSIMPYDIKTDRITSKGPKLLRDYIDFAINGDSVLKADISVPEEVDLQSPFEESVYDYLIGEGYNVASQVGCSGYRIDLGVYHPEYDGRFVLGIECDGASYHSARTARERDRLRQTILEDMGWKIYRIWSTDWVKDTASEKRRLKEAIDDAIANYSEKLPGSQESVIPIEETDEYVQLTEKSKEEVRAEYEERYRSCFAGGKPEEIPTSDYESVILKILQDGYGSRKMDNLIRDAAKYGYGWHRVGSNIKREFMIVLRRLERNNVIEVKDDDIRLIK